MLNILDRYIGKEIFIKISISFFSLIILLEVIKFFEQLKKIEQKENLLISLFFYILLTLPKDIGICLPISTLLGSALGFSTLDIRNELIAMHSLGFTQYQITKSIIKIIFPIVFLIFVINEVIIPVNEKFLIYFGEKEKIQSSIFFTKKNFWIKDKESFIFIEKIENKNKIIGIKIFNLNSKREICSIILSQEAIFIKDKWKLFQVNQIDFFNYYNFCNQFFLSKEWDTNISPKIIKYSILSPNELSIFEIHKYISYLKNTKQKMKFYQFFMWKKILSPILLYNAVLLSFNFSFNLLDNFSFGRKFLTGTIFSLLFYFLDQMLILFNLENSNFSILYIIFQNFFVLFYNFFMVNRY